MQQNQVNTRALSTKMTQAVGQQTSAKAKLSGPTEIKTVNLNFTALFEKLKGYNKVTLQTTGTVN